MSKGTLWTIGIAAVLAILFIFAVGKNHRLEGKMYEQEQAYQDSLSAYDSQLIESDRLIKEWQVAYDSLDVSNLVIDQKQLEIREQANNERKKRYENLVSIKRWSNDKRDEFWAKESSIQDTIITIPN